MSNWPSAGTVAEVPTERNLRDLRRRGGEVERRLNELKKEGLPASGKAGGVLKGEYPNPGFAKEPAYKAEIENEIEARKEVDLILKGEIETEEVAREDGDDELRAEIAELVVGPEGIEYVPVIDIRRFGAEPGAENHNAVTQEALATLAGSGRILWIPPGFDLRLTEPIVVDNCGFMGSRVFDIANGEFGSVVSLSGGLETTASHAVTIKHAGFVEGLTFKYPAESSSNSSPAISATGYVVRLETTAQRKGGRCSYNYFRGVPNAISNSQGWSEVSHNLIAATKVGIQDNESEVEHQIDYNQITVGLWGKARLDPINVYIAENAIAFKLTNTLATFTGNTVFGYREGYRFEGYASYTTIVGGLVDACRFCVRLANGTGPFDVTFSGVTMAAGVAGEQGGVRDKYATIESVGCLTGGMKSTGKLRFDHCMMNASNGDLLQVNNTEGSAPIFVTVNGGNWDNPGCFSHTYTLAVTEVVGTFTPSTTENNGDVITGGTSGAKGTVRKLESGTLYLDVVSGTFKEGETVTGSLSGAKAKTGVFKQGPRYQQVRFTDNQGGGLTFNATTGDLSAYLWAAGLWLLEGGSYRVVSNDWASIRSSTQNLIRVDTAKRFVEMGNTSTMTGATNKDLFVNGPVENPAVTGSSSYSR
jgi:hypothetical protein